MPVSPGGCRPVPRADDPGGQRTADAVIDTRAKWRRGCPEEGVVRKHLY